MAPHNGAAALGLLFLLLVDTVSSRPGITSGLSSDSSGFGVTSDSGLILTTAAGDFVVVLVVVVLALTPSFGVCGGTNVGAFSGSTSGQHVGDTSRSAEV